MDLGFKIKDKVSLSVFIYKIRVIKDYCKIKHYNSFVLETINRFITFEFSKVLKRIRIGFRYFERGGELRKREEERRNLE